jgi:hypothetical protein
MRGIDGFERRSSLKITGVAMRSGRERRSMPFSALAEAEHTDELCRSTRSLPASRSRALPGPLDLSQETVDR